MKVCFLPFFTASLQTVFLLVCGMCGLLQLPALGIFYAGFALLAYGVLKEKKKFFAAWCDVSVGFSILALAVIWILLRGKVAGHYDNFTHWALVVKNLLANNALPVLKDAVISYTNYPVGSAVWIYYFVTCAGVQTEDVWLFAQSVYMVFCLQSLFACVDRTKGWLVTLLGSLLVVLYANCTLSYNISIYNLLVDTLVPLCALAVTLFVGTEYCEEQEHRIVIRQGASPRVLCLIPMLCMLTQIKTSGLVFMLLPVGILAWSVLRGASRKDIVQTLAVIAVPFVLLLVWNIRHSIVFGAQGAGRHGFSLSSLQQTSGGQLASIAHSVFTYMFSGEEMLHLLCALVLAFLAVFFAKDNAASMFFKIFLGCVLVYLVYTVSLVCTYIFSMPLQEALRLAGITRYRRTMLIWLYGMLYISILFSLSHLSEAFVRQRFMRLTAYAVAFVCLFAAWGVYGRAYRRIKTIADDYICDELNMRIELEELLKAQDIPSGERYQLYLPEGKNSDYHRVFYGYLLSYLTNSADVIITTDADVPTAAETWFIRLPNHAE